MQKVGRKHSKKRDAILDLILSTRSHPGAQWVYDQLKPRIPGLSLATVYRNIGLFMNEGSVVSVGVVKGEERFDGRTEPHPHLVCSRCGRVCDMDCPNPRAMGDIGGLHSGEQGFAIDYRKTVFYGVCGECNTAGSARHEKG